MTIASIVEALLELPQAPAGHPSKRLEPAGFQAQGTLPVSSLRVEVQGFGVLPPFVQAPDLHKLQALTSAARFGQGEKTLLDTQVRDTGEIKADALHLTGWESAWPALEAKLQATLGLQDADLQAHLHNALLYGPGQFFKMHQDTEKQPGMVLTLVLVWPCAHLGGHLVVHGAQGSHRFESEHLFSDQIQWLAFYADCQHEVLPVKQGHRLVLTFNVTLRQTASSGPVSAPKLQAALARHFDAASPHAAARRLVLLLDHEYSARGLHWDLLKGADRLRAQTLRDAGQALGLRVHLALAEIHELWTAHPESIDHRRGRHSSAEPEPDELIENSTVLDHWLDTDNIVQPLGKLSVREDEIGWTRQTDEDDLVESEYQGYMGNYGETLDYWYRRAAIVLWPRAQDLAMQFDLDFDQALKALARLARQGDHASQVQDTVQAVKDRLLRLPGGDPQRFKAHCTIAAGLPDANLAFELLAPFSPWLLTPAHAAGLAAVQRAHGASFCDRLLQHWMAGHTVERQADQALAPWRYASHRAPADGPDLPATVQALTQAGLHRAWIEALALTRLQLWRHLTPRWADLTPQDRQRAWPWRLQQIAELIHTGLLLPEAALATAVVQELVRDLPPQDLIALSPLLIELNPVAHALVGWSALCQTVRQALDDALGRPLRACDDWSMTVPPMRCACKDCQQVTGFLKQTDTRETLLAMAEARRDHLQTAFGAAGLGLKMQVLRQGSPYKLLIGKPPDLHTREQRQHQQHRDWREALGGLVGPAA